MSVELLKHCIQMALQEALDARVPNQLVTGEEEQEGEEQEADSVREFAGVGGIAGYTAPLGMNPDKLGRKKNASKK